MGSKDLGYDILYRGETRDYIPPGRVILIERTKECGGGYWLGKAYDNAFIFEIERPVSLSEGLSYISVLRGIEKHADEFDDNFTLF
ncbi:MAG: hypothetical protein ACRDCA_01405 [Serratia sp. (in: enterobacteria)]|uniref:hypothetical protein n=1 Tax=Serratia sp. (in: enterobacteria) TaxID=616 RepID=UPI003F30A6B3